MDADFLIIPTILKNYTMPVILKCRFSYWFPLRYGVNVVNWPLNRVLLSYFASVYVRIITGMKIHDATAGFICYKRQVLENILTNKICGLCISNRDEV
jgi:hypothetical protein